MTSDLTLPSPTENGGLFFEIEGFWTGRHQAELEDRLTMLITGGLKNIHLHCGYRGSTGHSEHQPSGPYSLARDPENPNLTKKKQLMILKRLHDI